MATISNKSVKRAIKAKSNTRKNKRGDVNQQTVRADFAAFIKLEDDTSVAKATLRRDALRLTIADTALASEWVRQWRIFKSDTAGAKAIEARAIAKTYFFDWFAIPRSSDAKSDVAKAAATNIRKALEVVQECVAVSDMKYGDGFDFADDGKTYLTRGTTLAEDMWVHMEYEKVDTLKGTEYAKRNPSVIIHARSNQVHPGQVSWMDLRALLLDKTGQGTAGGARGSKPTVDATKPLTGLHTYASTADANKSAYATNSQKLNALDYLETILRKAVMNGPLFSEGWESVDKGFALWRAKLGDKVKPTTPEAVKSIATKSGAEVIDMLKRKGDVITPESAKSLPHPNGPNAKADTKTTAKAK